MNKILLCGVIHFCPSLAWLFGGHNCFVVQKQSVSATALLLVNPLIHEAITLSSHGGR